MMKMMTTTIESLGAIQDPSSSCHSSSLITDLPSAMPFGLRLFGSSLSLTPHSRHFFFFLNSGLIKIRIFTLTPSRNC